MRCARQSLQPLLLGTIGDQRVGDVVPGRKDRLLVTDRRLLLLYLAQFHGTAQPAAFEQRQREARP